MKKPAGTSDRWKLLSRRRFLKTPSSYRNEKYADHPRVIASGAVWRQEDKYATNQVY